MPGFRFARRYVPVFEVGGDFYDFVPLPEQKIGILIGDWVFRRLPFRARLRSTVPPRATAWVSVVQLCQRFAVWAKPPR